MSSRLRQIIFNVVLVASLGGLAWILLYSAGYHLDVLEFTLQPTGAVRLQVQPTDQVFITLGERTATEPTVSFVHLAPGNYPLTVSAAGYWPVSAPLAVEPRSTLLLEPLRLWPTAGLQPTTPVPVIPLPNTVLVANDDVIVLDTASGVVNRIRRYQADVISQQLATNISAIQLADDHTHLLLMNPFSLVVLNLASGSSETLTRLSTPIQAARWVGDTPYISYATGTSLHVIDRRSVMQYLDQTVATAPSPITALTYAADLNSIIVRTSDQAYVWSIVAK